MTPADRTVGEHVQEGRPRCGDGALDLDAQVVPVRRRGLRDVRHVVGDGDRGHVLALLCLPQLSRPAGLVVVLAANGVAPDRCTPVFM